MLMPAGVSAAIVKRLLHEVVTAMQIPDVRERFAAAGSEIVASTPEQLAARIKSESVRITRLVEAASLRER